jgi:hypothetical protein
MSKIPAYRELITVIGMTAFIAFSWTLYRFFFALPGWLLYLSTADIFFMLCYSFAFNTLECFCILILLLMMCAILPSEAFADNFVAQSCLMIVVLSIAIFLTFSGDKFSALYPFLILALILLNILIIQKEKLNKVIENVAERFAIFFYFYIPLGIASIIIVILRNL